MCKDNVNTDALSRLSLLDTTATSYVPPDVVFSLEWLAETPIKANQIKQWTERDPVLSKIKTILLQGPSVLEEFRNYATWKWNGVCRMAAFFLGYKGYCTTPGHSQIVEVVHKVHLGVSWMKSLAWTYVWWPKMDQELENKVRNALSVRQIKIHLHQHFCIHGSGLLDPGLDYI